MPLKSVLPITAGRIFIFFLNMRLILLLFFGWGLSIGHCEEPSSPSFQERYPLILVVLDATPRALHFAYFKDRDRQKTRSFSENELVFDSGYSIRKIQEFSVLLRDPKGQSLEVQPKMAELPSAHVGQLSKENVGATLTFQESKVSMPDRTAPLNIKRIPLPGYEVEIVQYDPELEVLRYAISANDLAKLEKQQMKLLSEIEVSPTLDGAKGEIMGLLLHFRIQMPLISALGMVDGDIVTQINGIPLKSFDQGLEIYRRLNPETRRVRIDLLRQRRHRHTLYLEMHDFAETSGKTRRSEN